MENVNLLTSIPENWSVFSGNTPILKYLINDETSDIEISVETGESPFCVLSHRFDVETDGILYEMSADIFLQSADSSAFLRASFIDGSGNWHGYSETQSVGTCNEWINVKKIFYGTKIEKCLCELVVKGSQANVKVKNFRLCKKKRTVTGTTNVNTKLQVSTGALDNSFLGFGAEADPKFFTGSNVEKISDLEEQWRIIEEKISEMKPHFVRVMFLPHIYEPEKGKITLDTEGCKHLFRYLDIFEKYGVRVNLTWWCVACKEMPWLAYPQDSWCSPPNDSMYAAESLAVFLKKIFNEKGYTCVKEIILMNEPNDSYKTDKGLDFAHYCEFYDNFDTCLKHHGIRDKITLIGSDETNNWQWFKNCVENMDTFVDAYSAHIYKWNFFDENLDKEIAEYIKSRKTFTNKPIIVEEFGQEVRPGYIIESVEHGLFLAAFAINALKGGASGACYWTLFDIYYGFGEANMMDTGLWAYYDRKWETRPSGIVWQMLTQNTTVGDKLYNLDGGKLDGLLFDSGKRKTIALLNRSNNNVNTVIDDFPDGKIVKSIIFNHDTWDCSKEKIKELEVCFEKGKITCLIPPESFAIIVIK